MHALAESPIVHLLPIKKVYPNPDNPRKRFDPAKLEKLQQSIATLGQKVPAFVCEGPNFAKDGMYMIISGERRYRARCALGLKDYPALILPRDTDSFLFALVENDVREQLNPMELVLAMQNLLNNHGMTQAEVAARVGYSQPHICNMLHLSSLPPVLQERVMDEDLGVSAGILLAKRGLDHDDILEAYKVWRSRAGNDRGKMTVQLLERVLNQRERVRRLRQAGIDPTDALADEDEELGRNVVATATRLFTMIDELLGVDETKGERFKRIWTAMGPSLQKRLLKTLDAIETRRARLRTQASQLAQQTEQTD